MDVGIQYLESWLRGSGCVPIAAALVEQMMVAAKCKEFLTLEAYRFL